MTKDEETIHDRGLKQHACASRRAAPASPASSRRATIVAALSCALGAACLAVPPGQRGPQLELPREAEAKRLREAATLAGAGGSRDAVRLNRTPGQGGAARLSKLSQGEATPGTSRGAVAGPFASSNVDLLSRITPQSFSTNSGCVFSSTNVCANDVWAYQSPSGREYAILGLYRGTGFVDVTDPLSPVVVGAIDDNPSVWSDMKTYQEYCYNCNESGGGIQIIDLRRIDPPHRQITLVGSLTASGLQTSHTMWINEASGYLYLCGSNLSGSGLVVVSLADPRNPVIVGQTLVGTYVHAAQVVTYTEGTYAGREIAFCFCAGSGLRIVDVTNKAAMTLLGSLAYPNLSYCHQGWLTDDRRHLLIDDELDELQLATVNTTTTYIINVENLSAPTFVRTFTNGMPSIDHNQVVRGNYAYQANYTSGGRVYDISDLNAVTEVGWLDTYPFNDAQNFNGAWGAALTASGLFLISDMHHGLFVLDPTPATGGTICPSVSAPQPEPAAVAKQRYLTLVPSNPWRRTAIRVKLVNLPPPLDVLNGQIRWVGALEDLQDGMGGPVYKRSRLTCEPLYMEWGNVGTLHIADDEIIPGGVYEIQEIGEVCNTADEGNFSGALSVEMPLPWGDVTDTSGMGPPDGVTNIADVAELVDKFKEIPGSIPLPQADLVPAMPDGVVNIAEVAAAADGFKGISYPYPTPSGCP